MDRGLGVDTLETSTSWSKVSTLHRDVIRTINETIRAESPPEAGALVMCHISHSYHDGCSLYFTFVFGQDTGREMEQWAAIKKAASQVISEHGAQLAITTAFVWTIYSGLRQKSRPWGRNAQSGAIARGSSGQYEPKEDIPYALTIDFT